MEQCMGGNQTCWDRSNIAPDPECVIRMLSNTVWRSWVGVTIRSSISRQSSCTCNLFRMLYQCFFYEILIESQSHFLTKLSSGRIFVSSLVAAAMNFTPKTFCNLSLKSDVSSFISVWVSCSSVATSPSVISSWLASSCVWWVVIVGGSMLGSSFSWVHCVWSARLTLYSDTLSVSFGSSVCVVVERVYFSVCEAWMLGFSICVFFGDLFSAPFWSRWKWFSERAIVSWLGPSVAL